jgi:hypothetical protein
MTVTTMSNGVVMMVATMLDEAVLEVACGRCSVWWMRWTVDLDQTFDEQLRVSATGKSYLEPCVNGDRTVRHNTPGTYYAATDRNWYRWTPGDTSSLPEGSSYTRTEFTCPSGCTSNVRCRDDKLMAAAIVALRHLHQTRTPLFRTTVDKLLKSAA